MWGLPTLNPEAPFLLDWGIIGFGEPLTRTLGITLSGLRTFPALSGATCQVPSTQQSMWIFLRGEDQTRLFYSAERVTSLIHDAFVLEDAMDTFVYAGGRDLTGYKDGTENPRDEAAAKAAFVSSGDAMNGSSFVAVQRWVHDLRRFRSFSQDRCNSIIGRRADTNAEILDSPPSAQVKRTAQESYVPPVFMVRRSMPWATQFEQGLEFIAYGNSLDKFERALRRMVGLDDGIVDALFSFSRPVTGGYYWCPPVQNERPDLRLVGL